MPTVLGYSPVDRRCRKIVNRNSGNRYSRAIILSRVLRLTLLSYANLRDAPRCVTTNVTSPCNPDQEKVDTLCCDNLMRQPAYVVDKALHRRLGEIVNACGKPSPRNARPWACRELAPHVRPIFNAYEYKSALCVSETRTCLADLFGEVPITTAPALDL